MPRHRFASGEVSHQLHVGGVFLVAIIFAMAFVDAPVAELVKSHSDFVHWLMRKITALGDSGWSIPLAILSTLGAMAAATVFPKRACQLWRNASLFVLINLVLSGFACIVLKMVIGRMRPDGLDAAHELIFSPFIRSAQYASMPSGHTTTAMALAFSLALILPRWRQPLILVAAMVGVSRVVLGVHWVSDLIAGTWLAYATVSYVAARFARLLSRIALEPVRV